MQRWDDTIQVMVKKQLYYAMKKGTGLLECRLLEGE